MFYRPISSHLLWFPQFSIAHQLLSRLTLSPPFRDFKGWQIYLLGHALSLFFHHNSRERPIQLLVWRSIPSLGCIDDSCTCSGSPAEDWALKHQVNFQTFDLRWGGNTHGHNVGKRKSERKCFQNLSSFSPVEWRPVSRITSFQIRASKSELQHSSNVLFQKGPFGYLLNIVAWLALSTYAMQRSRMEKTWLHTNTAEIGGYSEGGVLRSTMRTETSFLGCRVLQIFGASEPTNDSLVTIRRYAKIGASLLIRCPMQNPIFLRKKKWVPQDWTGWMGWPA